MKARNESSTMSLLSVYLNTSGDGIVQRSATTVVPEETTASKDEAFEDSHIHESVEPPLSLQEIERSGNSILHQRIPPSSQLGIHQNRANLDSRYQNMGESPLTACSYRTMKTEYDMETRRMYERIQAARTKSDDQLLSLVREAVGQIRQGEGGNVEDFFDDQTEPQQNDLSDSEGIFDLEL